MRRAASTLVHDLRGVRRERTTNIYVRRVLYGCKYVFSVSFTRVGSIYESREGHAMTQRTTAHSYYLKVE
jgi:hypothetical protein